MRIFREGQNNYTPNNLSNAQGTSKAPTQIKYDYNIFSWICGQFNLNQNDADQIGDFFFRTPLGLSAEILCHFKQYRVFYDYVMNKTMYYCLRPSTNDFVYAIYLKCNQAGLQPLIPLRNGLNATFITSSVYDSWRFETNSVNITVEPAGDPSQEQYVLAKEFGLVYGNEIILEAAVTRYKYHRQEPPAPVVAVGPPPVDSKPKAPEAVPQVPLEQKPLPDVDPQASRIVKCLENFIILLDIAVTRRAKGQQDGHDLSGAIRLVKNLLANIGKIQNDLPIAADKKSWLKENYYIYGLLEMGSGEAFATIIDAVSDYPNLQEGIKKHEKLFRAAWEDCVAKLNSHGIRVLDIQPGGTVVTDRELDLGWEVENTEHLVAPDSSGVYMVYGVLRKGIVVDGELVRTPVVNVYTAP